MNILEDSPRRKLYISVTAIFLLTLSIATVSLSRPIYAATPSSTGIVIPLYAYPTDSTWATAIQVHNAHPNVPMIIIADPTSSRAGTSIDRNFVSGIKNMQAAGITVLGYVDTIYAARGLTSAENDVTNWLNWYHPDGIFFDEFGGSMTYYSTLNAFVKALGLTYTMGNPGTNVPTSSYGILDSLVISENPSYPSLSALSSATSGYSKSGFAYLAYGVSLNTSLEVSSTQYVSWLYITNDGGGNPWDTLPSYFSNEVAAIDSHTTTTTSSSTSVTTTTTATSSATTSPITIKVRSVNSLGAQLTGMYVTIQSSSGGILAHGYTTFSYPKALSGTTYTVCVFNYQTTTFSHWGSGNGNSCQTVTPRANLVMTAHYG